MRIVTWNVNGLRKMKPLSKAFAQLEADIICIQETRISHENETNDLESLAFVPGYYSFFSTCRTRTGYSGVATYCRKQTATPIAACEGLSDDTGGTALRPNGGPCPRQNEPPSAPFRCACGGKGYTPEILKSIREEGRVIVTDHEAFVLINVYVPAISGLEERLAFKQSFLHALHAKIEALRAAGRHVILAGDMNISPARIDSADRMSRCTPADPHWEHASSSRVWLRTLLNVGGFVDSFRTMHPNRTAAYTCWSEATQGRKLNYGVRIDLIIVDSHFFDSRVTKADILPNITGSDHCPAFVEFNSSLQTKPHLEQQRQPPSFCTQFHPRFAKRQQTITRFFNDGTPTVLPNVLDSDLDFEIPSVPDSPPSPSPPMPLKLSAKTIAKKPRVQIINTRKAQFTRIERLKPCKQVTLKSFESNGMSTRSVPRTDKKAMHSESKNEAKSSSAEYYDSSRAETESSATIQANQLGKTQPGESAKAWRKLLSGPPPPPNCRHGNPCVLKTVTKNGENKGKTFFSCAYPRGNGRESNCNFFMWAPFNARFLTK